MNKIQQPHMSGLDPDQEAYWSQLTDEVLGRFVRRLTICLMEWARPDDAHEYLYHLRQVIDAEHERLVANVKAGRPMYLDEGVEPEPF